MKRLLGISVLLLLVACEAEQQDAARQQDGQQETAAQQSGQTQAPQQPFAANVAAEVNGEVILESEIDQIALDMFGEYQASALDEQSRQRLLDSMVSSLALAQKALAELPRAERAVIENKTRRYRENLLISEYVRLHMTPQPVTESMIQDYYQRNQELFGATELRSYRLITTSQPLSVDQRNAFLKRVAELKSESSLQDIHRKLRASGYQTSYQTGVAEPGLMSKKLQRVIDRQAPGKRSDVHYIDNKPYLVMVDEVRRKKAKPLSQARAGIRKTLAMSQLKEAVKSLSTMAKQEASVTIH